MKKRIAMISEHASPVCPVGGVDSGGQNVYVAQLAWHLADAGYEVDVFTRRDNPALPQVLEWRDGVRVVFVPAGPACFVPKEDMLPYMAEFRDWMARRWHELGGYDLIHANFWMSGLVAAGLKQRMDVPFAITFHALGKVRRRHLQDADRFPDSRFAVEDRLVHEADAIIAECPQDRRDLIELYGADAGKIVVVPCGFDPAELAPMCREDARRALGMREDEQVVLNLGRLVPRKGIETIVRAAGRLRREHGLEPRLLVVGGDSHRPDARKTPEIARLRDIACREGVRDLVSFTGRRDRDCLRYFYAAADVFVTTPAYEPFGMTPLEAMACARPVVGSEVGGIKYSVKHGETGFLVPPDNPGALAERLAFLLRNPEVAEHMGRRGLERAHAGFTWKAVAEQIAALFETLLPPPSTPALRMLPNDRALVEAGFDDALAVLSASRNALAPHLIEAARTVSDSLAAGGKLLLCGNGGSAADAQHFAAELVGRFQLPGRPALPALALTADTTVLTAWANDESFDDVFARQVDALGREGDVLIAISTSGRSTNVLRAVEAAHRQGMESIALSGRDGGPLARCAGVSIVVPSQDTQRIQEVHSLAIHLLCQLIENALMHERPRVARHAAPPPSIMARRGNGRAHVSA